jgi:GNAT superfamily N-acetyltransferase
VAQVIFRIATRADVPAILDLLTNDEIARSRAGGGSPAATSEEVDAAVWAAFEQIDADPRNELIVADEDGEVVGTCQLTFTPSLSRGGTDRMTIEAVRVRTDRRGRGVGRAMMLWSLGRARERGCRLAQLTTDKRRTDAHRFYSALGFEPSHEGFKMAL